MKKTHTKYAPYFRPLMMAVAGIGLLIVAVYATHEDTATDTYTVNGVTVLGTIDLGKLIVCADCGYTVVDQPEYQTLDQARLVWQAQDLVLGISFNGVVKAYPLQTLSPVRFHIVNDLFDDIPLTISFCPLCFSGVVFKRPIVNGQAIGFATAGLYQRDLVMYDNVTYSLWQQFTGEPLAGTAVGQFGLLHRIPADIVPFEDWVASHPDSLVYVNPVLSAPRRSRTLIPQLQVYEDISSGTGTSSREASSDSRLKDRDIVVGITINGQAKAYQESAILSALLLNDTVGSSPILVLVDPLSSEIKFFERDTAQGTLSFTLTGETLEDAQTGSLWDFSGKALSGPLSGIQLVELAGLPSYWFAWVTFHPDTALFKG